MSLIEASEDMVIAATSRHDPMGEAFEQLWSDIVVVALRGGAFSCAPDWELQQRTMPNYQLWLGVEGAATLALGDRTFELVPGASLLVPPYVPHRGTHNPHDPLHCYVLHFTLHITGSAAPLSIDVLPSVLRAPPAVWTELLEYAKRICTELEGRRSGRALLANGAICCLLGSLRRLSVAQGNVYAQPLDRSSWTISVSNALAHIAAHFAEPLTLADLAEVAGYSCAHFSTIFQNAVGLAPIQYVRRYRLQRAKELLVDSNLTVAEIASAVGFLDPFYFSRTLKRMEGLSPTRYRLSKRSSDQP